MPQTRIQFGLALKKWRESQHPKVSQEALARRMGRSTQTISRWERGEHDIESEADAAWIREHAGIDPPRPVRSAITKLSMSERISNLENEFSELRRLVTESIDALTEGATVVLPSPGEKIPQTGLEASLEEATPRRRDSPKRPRRGPEHG